MSEGAVEAVELPRSDDAAFSALMDFLAPEQADGEAGTGAPAAGAASGADTGAASAAGGAGAGDGAASGSAADTTAEGASAAGDGDGGGAAPADSGQRADADAAGGEAEAAGGEAAAGGAAGGTGARPVALSPAQLGELSTKLEERVSQTYQAAALEEVQTEHKSYFEALEKHPMELVGQSVPAIGREGQITLSSPAEAREWQDAIKHVLVREVRSRASKSMDENKDFLTTVHASISLFQDNPDLVPGAAGFDLELANRLVQLVAPYELRVDGKLQGYTIPVQPIVDQLRAQVVRERAAAASSAAATGGGDATTPPPVAKTTPPPADPPQAGITSKAGAGAAAGDDFSTLFGTIHPSLANLQI